MNSIAHIDTAAGPESVAAMVDRFGTDATAGGPTVLAVWAHPDDESLLAGGLLAEVTRRGGRVVTVCATAGEHGTDDPVVDPPVALAARRVTELDAALAALGAEPAIHLGYEDGGCCLVSEHLAAHLIGRVLDRVAPDVILTFGPDGVTGHPDHLAVGRWVRRAVADRGDRIPLVTTVAASAWPADGIDRLHSIEAFWPGFPKLIAPDLVVHLDDELLDRKIAAIGCHGSQMGPVHDALGAERLARVAGIEGYAAANPAARHHMSPEPELLTAA